MAAATVTGTAISGGAERTTRTLAALVASMGLAAPVGAQQAPPLAPPVTSALPPSAATAQPAVPGTSLIPPNIGPAQGTVRSGWRIAPRLSLSGTYSTNLARNSGTGTGTGATTAPVESGWIRGLGPGVRIDGAGARVRGSLDYQYTDNAYSKVKSLHNHQQSLNSFVNVEAVEKQLFVDARATISQQYRSAFGAVATSALAANSNRVETTTTQVSPYMRGRIGDLAAYDTRLSISNRSTQDRGTFPNTDTTEWTSNITTLSRGSKFRWGVDTSLSTVESSITGKQENARVSGSVIYDYDPETHLTLLYGRESTDYGGLGMRSRPTNGVRVEWTPSPRTSLSATREKRFFGNSHNVLLTHRTAFLSLRFSSSKDVTLSAYQQNIGPGSMSELLTSMLSRSIPDPTARAQVVGNALAQIGGDFPIDNTYLTSNLIITTQNQVSAAYITPRENITLSLSQSDRELAGATTTPNGSFAQSSSIRTRNLNASWAHRLTPVSTLTLSASRLRNQSLSGPTLGSNQNVLGLRYSAQLSSHINTSLGLQRTKFDSTTTAAFVENALLSTMVITF